MNRFKKYDKCVLTTLIFTLMVTMSLLTACGTFNGNKSRVPYKTLSITKSVAEEIVGLAKTMNFTGKLSDGDLVKVKALYNKCRAANELVINSVIAALDIGIAPENSIDYVKAFHSYEEALDSFYEFSKQIGLTVIDKER